MSMNINNAWQGKRVLITGAGGFIGRHLVRALRALGADLALVVRKRIEEFHSQEQFVGDMRIRDFVVSAVATWNPDVVFHLSANRDRSLGGDAFNETMNANFFSSLYLLEELERCRNISRIVFVGTAEEYGCGQVPFCEDARESPVTAYSLSKLSCTHLAQMWARTKGMPITVLRPSVAYGPEQQDDMFIPALIRALLNGNFFAMTAGKQTRDFVYIDDLVEALVTAGLTKTSNGEVINIGSGNAVRILDLVAIVEEMTNRTNLVQCGAIPYRLGDPMNYQLDIKKAARVLGWHPRISLAQGLKYTVNWYKAHL